MLFVGWVLGAFAVPEQAPKGEFAVPLPSEEEQVPSAHPPSEEPSAHPVGARIPRTPVEVAEIPPRDKRPSPWCQRQDALALANLFASDP